MSTALHRDTLGARRDILSILPASALPPCLPFYASVCRAAPAVVCIPSLQQQFQPVRSRPTTPCTLAVCEFGELKL